MYPHTWHVQKMLIVGILLLSGRRGGRHEQEEEIDHGERAEGGTCKPRLPGRQLQRLPTSPRYPLAQGFADQHHHPPARTA